MDPLENGGVDTVLESPIKYFLLVGRRGSGKSSLSSLMVQGPRWKNGQFHVVHSETSSCSLPKSARSVVAPIEIYDSIGWDDTIQRKDAILDIQKITENKTIHGIIFVFGGGRADTWDRTVFTVYLQWVFGLVPNSQIGIVITHAPPICVEENTWKSYQAIDNLETPFLNEVLGRCDRKICFVNNLDPGVEMRHGNNDNSILRELSFNNVLQFMEQFKGEHSFNLMSEKCYRYYVRVKEEIRISFPNHLANVSGIVLAVLALLITTTAAKLR